MNILTGFWRDVKLAVRSLARARAFTAVCVISLGIGMAPVIAVPYAFQVFTSPPRGLNIDGLVEVVTTSEGPRQATYKWAYPDFEVMRDSVLGVTLTAWATHDTEVGLPRTQGGRLTARTMFVSTNYFQVVDTPLAQGAGLRDDADPIVVVSHDFWQQRLNADPAVVGRVIPINDVAYTVVGVAPESFTGHLGFQEVDLWLPLARHPLVVADTSIRFDRSKEWVNIHGRLAAGVDRTQASTSIRALTTQLAKDHAVTNEHKLGVVASYHPQGSLELEQIRLFLTLVQTLTTLPLLVVCLNIAGMVQVRNAIRERELSIRQAIGATRRILVRQLLAESLVLATFGALLASLVLFNIAPITAWWMDQPLPSRFDALRVTPLMLVIVGVLCLLTTLIFGWLPAARYSRPVIITALKDDAGGGRARVGRLQRFAVALQVAIATPLLILSAMTLDRVRATATNDLGFDAEVLYSAPLRLTAVEPGTARVRLEGARQALAQVPGVDAVTITDGLPLDFRYRITRVATQPAEGQAPKVVASHVTRVGDDYFKTLGIVVVRGRAFGADDIAGAEEVAMLAKPLAEQLFPDEDPLGKRLTFAAGEKTERTVRVVGVTSDFPTSQMSTNRAQVLLPLAQYPNVIEDSVDVNDDRGGTATLMLVARSAPGQAAATMTAALEQSLRDLDPDFEASSIVTGTWLRQNSVSDFLTQSAVAGVVGSVLLLLAALGIYGVVGLMVATRVREIAVRVALGASRARVLRMVLVDVVKLVTPGVTVGILLAVAFVKLNGEDFGIALSGLEPVAYVIGAAVALLIAVVASLAPARRAASVQPMVAMRAE